MLHTHGFPWTSLTPYRGIKKIHLYIGMAKE